MQALAKTQAAPGHVELVEMEPPQPGPGEIRLRVSGGGVCGTDVAFHRWYADMAREYDPPLPIVMGHEFAGTVETLGEGVDDLAPGQPVAVNPHVTCGRCRPCGLGRQALCRNRRILGLQAHGGWAPLAVVPRINVVPLPEGIAPPVTALMEPLTVAVHAVAERAPTQPGDTVVVMGCGPIGLLHLLVARHCGAREVLVSGLGADRERLRVAESLGGIPVDVESAALTEAVRRVRPEGAHVVYDTSGSESAVREGLGLLDRGGRLALVGFHHGEAAWASLPLVLEEKEIIGCRAYDRETWRRSAAMLAPLEDSLARLVTHQLPLTELDQALALVERRECLKVVLQAEG